MESMLPFTVNPVVKFNQIEDEETEERVDNLINNLLNKKGIVRVFMENEKPLFTGDGCVFCSKEPFIVKIYNVIHNTKNMDKYVSAYVLTQVQKRCKQYKKNLYDLDLEEYE